MYMSEITNIQFHFLFPSTIIDDNFSSYLYIFIFYYIIVIKTLDIAMNKECINNFVFISLTFIAAKNSVKQLVFLFFSDLCCKN